jgi:hypothetical protein
LVLVRHEFEMHVKYYFLFNAIVVFF